MENSKNDCVKIFNKAVNQNLILRKLKQSEKVHIKKKDHKN